MLPVLFTSSSAYEIAKSLRFRASAGASLTRVPAAGDRRTFTISLWLKRGLLGVAQYVITASPEYTNQFAIYLPADNTVHIFSYVSSVFNLELKTTAVLRDPSAWYHLVLAIDTTQATNTDRAKFYVNGERVTAFTTATYPAQNHQTPWNSAVQHNIGKILTVGYLDGYQTEINSIEGQALDPSYFGKTDAATGQWVPKKYTGSYGTNGFYLDFKDGTSLTTLGYDKSGNSNNWTLNNISLTAGVTYDWMDDTPSNNFAVLNPLIYSAVAPAISNANMHSVLGSGAAGQLLWLTIPIRTGKWYAEFTIVTVSTNSHFCGLVPLANTLTTRNTGNTYVGSASGEYGYGRSGSSAFKAISGSYTNTGTTLPVANDIIGLAYDADSGVMEIYLNNVKQSITGFDSIPTGEYFFAVSGAGYAWGINCGQRPFAYTPPTGFKALCTKNLPTPQVKNGADYFDVVLDSGANIKTASEALFGNFFEWIKDRANANNHQLIDSVRGNSAVLQSNTTAAETTYSAPSGNSVGWVWRIAAGFLDVVTYTGTGVARTVAHNLGAVPAMMIVKNRSAAGYGWLVYHHLNTAAPETDYLNLQSTAATADLLEAWNDTKPTSSELTVGSNAGVNANGNAYVAWLFAEVEGFSKFGSYTGNGSADGPFVYCGFKPKFILLKATGAATGWATYDVERSTFNVVTAYLGAEASSVESAVGAFDVLSNGFKVRTARGSLNVSSGNFIFAAFAECPFKYATAR